MCNKSNTEISASELKIVKLLWEESPLSSKQIHEHFSNNWSIQTIKTFLSRMVAKNALSYTKVGKEFLYYPLLDKQTYTTEQAKKMVEKMFGGSFSLMVSNMIENKAVTKQEIDKLRKILEGEKDV